MITEDIAVTYCIIEDLYGLKLCDICQLCLSQNNKNKEKTPVLAETEA